MLKYGIFASLELGKPNKVKGHKQKAGEKMATGFWLLATGKKSE